MPLALIAAVAGNDLVIGKDGDLPWHYSSDLKFFKNMTLGHSVVMGRITYQSIVKRLGKPLPGRTNIILSHDKNIEDPRVTICHDPQKIIDMAQGDDVIFVIGGASLYRLMMDAASILYITHIDRVITGDTYFPRIDAQLWRKVEEQVTLENDTPLRFCTYKRSATA
jgi:dihydrofolate reductase